MMSVFGRDLSRKQVLRTGEQGHGDTRGAAGDGSERLWEVGRRGSGWVEAGRLWGAGALGATPSPPLPRTPALLPPWQLPRVTTGKTQEVL